MMFVIEIFGKPDSRGNAVMIERRTHTGSSVTEALRTAQANLRTPPPSAYSFSMKANGKEVGRWRRDDDHNKADVLDDDLESANASPPADGDEIKVRLARISRQDAQPVRRSLKRESGMRKPQ